MSQSLPQSDRQPPSSEDSKPLGFWAEFRKEMRETALEMLITAVVVVVVLAVFGGVGYLINEGLGAITGVLVGAAALWVLRLVLGLVGVSWGAKALRRRRSAPQGPAA